MAHKKNIKKHWLLIKPKHIIRYLVLFVIVCVSISIYFIYKQKITPPHGKNPIPANSNNFLQKYLTNLVPISKLESSLVPNKNGGFSFNHDEFSHLYLKTFFINYKKTQTYELINLDFNFFYKKLDAEVYIKYTFNSYNKLENNNVDIHYDFTTKNKS